MFLLGVDGLGRFDVESLPDQAIMEILISQLVESTVKQYQTPDGDFTDKCTWSGVACDKDGNVTSIKFNWLSWWMPRYSVPEFNMFPRFLQSFSLHLGSTSSIDIGALPPSLEALSVNVAKVDGVIKWDDLPENLEILNLQHLRDESPLIVKELPRTLKHCTLSCNSLVGSLAIEDLPPAIEKVDLSTNSLSGELNLPALPKTVKTLLIFKNDFSGSVDLSALPPNLENMKIGSNKLSGELQLDSLPQELRELSFSYNSFEGGVDLTRLPPHLRWLNLSQNRLSGTVDTSALPAAMSYLCLTGNPSFEGVLDISREGLSNVVFYAHCGFSEVKK